MKLSALTSRYVAYKQAMGMRFHTEARTLRSFCRTMGDIAVADIAADRVHAYIAGVGPVTRFWHRKYEVLRGFYRFAIARGYAASAPLPKIIPKPPHFVPYIFSQEELQRLLDASAYCERPRSKLQPYTCRMLILLLYGAALRISEALSPSRWPMWICLPAYSRFEKANSTRRGWYPLVRISPAPWGPIWRCVPRSTPLHWTQHCS